MEEASIFFSCLWITLLRVAVSLCPPETLGTDAAAGKEKAQRFADPRVSLPDYKLLEGEDWVVLTAVPPPGMVQCSAHSEWMWVDSKEIAFNSVPKSVSPTVTWNLTMWCWIPRATSRSLILACVRKTSGTGWQPRPSVAPQTTSPPRWADANPLRRVCVVLMSSLSPRWPHWSHLGESKGYQTSRTSGWSFS